MAWPSSARSVRAILATLALCISWPAALAGGHDAGEQHNTTLLAPASFDVYIAERAQQRRPVLVMFHVSWCKVCTRTFPKFAAASDMVVEKALPIDFAHVDCTDDKSLCQRFQVKGYPTIKLFRLKEGSEPLPFKGTRSEVGFLKYAERMTQPPVRRLTGPQFAEALKGENLAAFVAAVQPGTQYPAGLQAVAEQWMDRHVFAASAKLKDLLPDGAGVPEGASLAVLSLGAQQWPGAQGSAVPPPAVEYFSGSLDNETAVAAWVQRSRFPGIWALDEANFYEFTHASRSAVMVAVDPARLSRGDESILRDAQRQLKADFLFGVVDGVAWAEELADFHIVKEDLPRVLVTEDDFEAWVEDVEALRFESLERDLRAMGPLLRQGHSAMAKALYYKREAWRFLLRAYAYAQQGPVQQAAVAAGATAAVMLCFSTLWCCAACCRALMIEDPDDFGSRPGAPPAGRAKRD